MKILHVASFVGNIGDNASHIGVEKVFRHFFQKPQFKRIEIRKAYQNFSGGKLIFADEFVKQAQKFDLILFGGGAHLSYDVETSSNGTTIDITCEQLKKIGKPILFNSVSCLINKSSEKTKEKFLRFYEGTSKNEKVVFAFRNDGSIKQIQLDFGDVLKDNTFEVLDSGFFFSPKSKSTNKKQVGINLAFDQVLMNTNLKQDFGKVFYEKITNIVEFVVSKGYKIVFIPHIHKDLKAISTVLELLDDYFIRENIVVGECKTNKQGAIRSFDLYNQNCLNVCTRLHANICSLGMGKPTISLGVLGRITEVCNDINFTDNLLDVSGNFDRKIIADFDFMLERKIDLTTKKQETLMIYDNIFRRLEINI